MKKTITLILACFVLFTGCTKREPNPVIVDLPVEETERYPVSEVVADDLSDEESIGREVSGPESAIIDLNSLGPVSEESEKEPDVIFVPTPNDVVLKMLELARVQKDDLLYDLGCGDGRIVVTAAKMYGCRAVGYDIDPERVEESLDNVARNNVGHLVKIEKKDIFTLDLSKANVITLYLLPELNVRLIPQLKKLKDGSRIVSHDFRMRGVKPDRIVRMTSIEDESEHRIFLWTTPLKKREKETDDDADSEFTIDYGMSEIEEWISPPEPVVP